MKCFLHSLAFSIALNILFFLFNVGKGFLNTYFYQPQMMDAYKEINNLKSEITFGYTASLGTSILILFFQLVAGMLIYYLVKRTVLIIKNRTP
ncbi:hypothetical protein P4S95_16230 [Aneurinibacillus aneurinilyticus]|jgi:hypothetical protein|uniref:hypothetical protein n=1 Tax=Aneurinibacillus aneurinilyticus TaxID=1391 RepID=UPI002E1C4CAD|nr:hypothetical protein [Aneurinibacillus aneurinilyticus]